MCHGEIFSARCDIWQSTDVLYSPTEQRKAAGMIIDLDNGVDLNDKEAREKELKERTVSHKFLGVILTNEVLHVRGRQHT